MNHPDRLEASIQSLSEAIRLRPADSDTFIHLGSAILKLRRQRQENGQIRPDVPLEPDLLNEAAQGALDSPISEGVEAGFFYCPGYRFVYAPVPKVACSSFKALIYTLFLDELPELPIFGPADFPGRNFHIFMDRTFVLGRRPENEARAILASSRIFKFAFVRNPLGRVVSGYLDKFVVEQSNPEQWEHTLPVLRDILGPQAEPGRDGITFRQFVDYLSARPDEMLDKHWRPMYRFFDSSRMDFIGRVENLPEDFSMLRQRLSIPRDLPFTNRTSVRQAQSLGRGLADLPPESLQSLPQLPSAEQLYDNDLELKVRARYAEDFRIFGYD